MRIPWRAQEYERTCDDCGYVWRVPRWAVHPPMQGLPMVNRGTVAIRYSVDAVVTANAELAEEAASFRVCDKCGSVHYAQRRIWF
jgi:predicted RNA-binding Zn-ribbon protein involved in translation (DUF1610 family)